MNICSGSMINYMYIFNSSNTWKFSYSLVFPRAVQRKWSTFVVFSRIEVKIHESRTDEIVAFVALVSANQVKH